MSLKIWLDGKLVPKEDAKLSVYDHGTLYGDGVFEGMRVYSGRVFKADAHLHRLYDSAKAIRMTIPYSLEELKAATVETVKANSFQDCYIRLVVTRGSGYLGLNPAKCPRPAVFIIADTIEMYARETYDQGISIITASVIRNHPNAISPRVKSLNYLNNILARIEAVDAGVPEALMLNHNGNVSECTADNIFLATDNAVYTPPASDGALEGITRGVIIGLCNSMGISCSERTLQRHDVYIADECFLTGTAAEVIPVTKIDGRIIGSGTPGPLTKRLMEAFGRYIREA